MNDNNNDQEIYHWKKWYLNRIGNRYITPSGLSFPITLLKGRILISLLFGLAIYITIIYYTIIYFTLGKFQYTIPIIQSIAFIIDLASLIRVATLDPGIMFQKQKNSHYYSIEELTVTVALEQMTLSICPTCLIIEEPRMYHCSKCNVCIHRLDHHCDWLSTCIGFANHKSFLFFLIMTIGYLLQCAWILICLFFFVHLIQEEKDNKRHIDLTGKIICSISSCLVLIGLCVTIHTLISQVKCIMNNQTVCETIKNKHRWELYSIGSYWGNVKEFWLNPLGFRDRVKYNSHSIANEVMVNNQFLNRKYNEIYNNRNNIEQRMLINEILTPLDL